MIIKKGTYRYVVVIESLGIALKFPIFRLIMFLGTAFYQMKRGRNFWQWIGYEVDVYHGAKWYFKGVVDNWREFLFFRRHSRHPFLQPMYFSLFGIVNICPCTEDCSISEFRNLQCKMLEVSKGEIADDGHHFGESDNFCFYDDRVCMRDYGSLKTQRIILNNIDAFNRLTASPKT